MESLVTIRKVKEYALLVLNRLRNIFMLNLSPDRMHEYVPLAEQMNINASNLADLLADMNPEKQQLTEKELTDYVRPLSKKGHKRI